MKPFSNEPVRRFASSTERDGFQQAIAAQRAAFPITVPLVIGKVSRAGTADLFSENPAAPAEIVGRCAAAGMQETQDAVLAAERAFPAWRDMSWAQRAAILERAAEYLHDRRDQLAALEILEAGKTWREADADVCEAIDFLRYHAAEGLRLSPGVRLDVAGESNHYFYEARGPGAVISPWNFPLAIPAGMISAALMAGNSVVFKPAPQTPVIAFQLYAAFAEAGLPEGVLNFLPGGDEAGAALVADPRIHFVAFTGSRQVGCKIYAQGALVAPGQNHLKRIIAEMGGKNAIIVDADADMDEAVTGVAASAFGYQGQKCSAASRVIVVDGDRQSSAGIYERFIRRLAEVAASLRIGMPEDSATMIGPVIDAAARQNILRAIEAGKTQAKLVLAVQPAQELRGHFVGPHIFRDVPPDSALAQEEIFGPVLAVMRAGTFPHALEIANDSMYALTGGVYSRSPAHLQMSREKFRVGNLYLNRKITGAIVGRQPFGGFKMSGVGSKAGGPDYLLQFLEPRTITENNLRHGFAPDLQ